MAEDIEDVIAGRLPRHRRGVGQPVAKENPLTGELLEPAAPTPGSLDADMDAAFSTLVPSKQHEALGTSAPTSEPLVLQPAPGRLPGSVSFGRLGRSRHLWALALSVAIVAGAMVYLSLRSPSKAELREPGPATPQGSAPETAAATTDLWARAVAAHDGGDLQASRALLGELLAREPEYPGAAAFLEKAEDELWRQSALPLTFYAEHDHRLGSCRGRLVLDETGAKYASRDHQWHWHFDDIHTMNRPRPRHLDLETLEKELLRLGGPKRYRFKLLDSALDREDWTRFLRLRRAE